MITDSDGYGTTVITKDDNSDDDTGTIKSIPFVSLSLIIFIITFIIVVIVLIMVIESKTIKKKGNTYVPPFMDHIKKNQSQSEDKQQPKLQGNPKACFIHSFFLF